MSGVVTERGVSDANDVGGETAASGGSEVARSQYLGSAGRTALVRCGHCRRRNYFDLARWPWLTVALCRCRRGILFHTLSVISYREAQALAQESTVYGGELRALRDVEAALRRFLTRYEAQPYWLWAPQTRDLVAEERRALAVVEATRARRAAGEAEPVRFYELSGEEAQALTHLSGLPPDRRRVVLTMLADVSRWDEAEGEGGREPAGPDDVELERALERLEAEGGRADVGTST